MRDLMIGHGKRAACAEIEQLASKLLLDGEPALLAKQTIEVNGACHRRDAVLGKNDDAHAALVEEADEVAGDVVDLAKVLRDGRVGRAKALEVIVEMRQINERKRGRVLALNPFGGFRDPSR